MPLQYFYPAAESGIVFNGTNNNYHKNLTWAKENHSILDVYQSVNNGVSAFDDNDYIYPIPTSGTTNWIGPVVSFRFDEIQEVYPSSIIVNIRGSGTFALGIRVDHIEKTYYDEIYRNSPPPDYTFGRNTILNHATYYELTSGVFTGGYKNYSTSVNIHDYAAIKNINIADIILRLQLGQSSELTYSNARISEVEMVFDGELYSHQESTLFIEGNEQTATGIPLFIEGHGNFYSGCDLWLQTGQIHDNITLFLDGLDPVSNNNDMDLVIWTDGANGSGDSNKYTTLFIEGSTELASGIPLFIEGGNFDTRSGNIPLYLEVNEGTKTGSTDLFLRHEILSPSGGTMPLFVSNHITNSGNIPLFINVLASGEHNKSIPLYMTNESSGNKFTTLAIFNEKLTMSGGTNLFTTSFWSDSGNAPLFIEGPASGNILKTAPLYLKTIDVSYYNTVSGRRPLTMTVWNNQQDKYKSMDLYIGQSTSSSGNIPLVIEGGGIDDRTKFTDLYLHNRVESSGSVPLSLLTGVTLKSIPLSMTGFDPAKDNSGIPLFTYSADGSGIFAGNELFLQSDTFGNTTPLFMNVIEVGYPVSNIPLYINNDNEHKMSMSMFLESVRWTSGTQNLFVKGLGLQPGAEVGRQNISMFLAREVDSTSYSMYMHLAAPSGESQVIPIVLEGGTYSQLETTLFLPEAMGSEGSGMNIHVHGF